MFFYLLNPVIIIIFENFSGELGCGDTWFSGSNGVIISPYFPLPFPDKINCKYSINIGQSNSVQLKFKHFHLKWPESTSNCPHQWLTVCAMNLIPLSLTLFYHRLNSLILWQCWHFPCRNGQYCPYYSLPDLHNNGIMFTLCSIHTAQGQIIGPIWLIFVLFLSKSCSPRLIIKFKLISRDAKSAISTLLMMMMFLYPKAVSFLLAINYDC